MTLRLVTEARPIPWNRLFEAERQKLLHANEWIKAVQGDAGSPKSTEKSTQEHIDPRRSGRVLFIDGVRGAGKTSMLLTLLQLWKRELEHKDFIAPSEKLHLFWPVLDFDPLPRGMPLQGWLLEPWRRQAENLDKEGKGSPGPIDLTEKWADLFERAVIGWTHVHVEGQGVVEKALAYHEQASGWLETQQKWRQFVGTMVCRRFGCRNENETCKSEHPFIFVVAIDDVDLQVEQLPQLLHAIRLLHHPNVAYVLTGNYDHLSFVLGLDYIRRHEHRGSLHRHSEQGGDDKLWDEIKKHSFRLRNAFLEKALPQSAIVTLPHLTFADVLKFAAAESSETGVTLDASTWTNLPKAAQSLHIITARQAQHAIDRHLAHSKIGGDRIDPTHKFIAELCGTEIEPEIESTIDSEVELEKGTAPIVPTKFTMRGELTTGLGPTLRVWKGDGLNLVLTDRPSFVFFPDFDDTNALLKEDAHRALLVQLLVDQKNSQVVAYGLEWAPDAGILTTHVVWNPKSTKVARTAIFHWPWLEPPSAAQALELRSLSQKMSKTVGTALEDPKNEMVAEWLLKNIEWWLTRNPKETSVGVPASLTASTDVDAKPTATLAEFANQLKQLRSENPRIEAEVDRWVRELYVMTAPYFGLPASLAESLRDLINSLPAGKPDDKDVLKEQDLMVGNAIINTRTDAARNLRKIRQHNNDLDSTQLDDLTQQFLEERKRRLSGKAELAMWIPPAPQTPSRHKKD